MRRRLLLLGSAAVLAGCASTPPRYYRLATYSGAERAGAGMRIAVRNVGVPAALSATSLPMPGNSFEANSFPNDLWAASLADMLQGTMVQNLAQRLPGDIVLAGGGAVGAPPDIYVEINVFSFSPDTAGTITLQAQLATRHATAQDWQVQNFTAKAAGGTTPETIVAAMSALWGLAADAVAGMV